MASFVDGPTGSYEAGEALAVNLRVKLNSSNQLVKAGSAEAHEGTTVTPAYAQGDTVTIRYANAQGTRKYIAAGAIAIGAIAYPAASGKVSATSAGTSLGKVVNRAAAADGDVIEVIQSR